MFPDCKIIGGEAQRVPHIFAVAFSGLMNEALLYSLYRQNIEASIGGGQFQTLTTILKQCGHTDETSLGAISFALSEGTTEDDLRMALDAIVIAVRKLKKMSVAL
jgi:cysteine sulfinate desulfinase/cysteine desulfurase-like protein